MGAWRRRASPLVASAFALTLVRCATRYGSEDPATPEPPPVGDAGGGGEASLDGSTPDGAVPVVDAGPLCDKTKPFGAPARLAELDPTIHAASPRLSHDELTLYFTTSSQAGDADLARMVRLKGSATFGPVVLLPANTSFDDNDPSVSADHLRLFFHSTRGGNGDLFAARRGGPLAPFGDVQAIQTLNTDAGEAHPYYRQAASELWFVREDVQTLFDIYVATETSGGFGPPQRVTELSSTANEWLPQISEDGLTILFASDRGGGKGGFDLWLASRANEKLPFSSPVPIDELNTAANEFAGWLSADGCRIWFSSNRADAGGLSSIYFAERPR
ncbi:MAG: PD40 domain-containing protein [Deltaproteobacteria bacterium]|nr:PD40 domain-containing protein [Deltaproteobacteria bacterium]